MKQTACACLLALSAAAAQAADQADKLLDLARRTLVFVERDRPSAKLRAELDALAGRVAEARQEVSKPVTPGLEPQLDPDRLPAVLGELRKLRRRIILSHPALDFDRLLINKRMLPRSQYTHLCDQYYGRHSRPGPGLTILDNWKDQPRQTVLLAGKLPAGSTVHPDLSFDGRRVIFAFCDHTAAKPPGVHIPTHPVVRRGGWDYDAIGHRRFFIYEATIDGRSVRQLTGGPADPRDRAGGRRTVLIEDFDPCYLPGGGFVFVSTRCQSFGRCHWGRYTPCFLLYRAAADGGGIRPISFGEANEWDPCVLPDGRLIYTRWDYVNRHNSWFQSLWVMRPDGTGTAHYYGNYSRNPCMTSEARPIPGSHKVVCTATAHHYFTAGSIIVIDPQKGEDGMEPVRRITPEVVFPETEGWSPNGAYATPWPLSEDLFLVSYSPLPVRGGRWPKDNSYAIYLIDTLGGRELIFQDDEAGCFCPIPLRRRPRPPVLPTLAPAGDQTTAAFYVQQIHTSRHDLPPGSIRAIRINRLYRQPTADKAPLSPAGDELIKAVVGTVPVGPDGSAAFRAPAGVPLQFQALDADGLAVMTMRSSVYVQPGESIGCIGCHEHRHTVPPVRAVSRLQSRCNGIGDLSAGLTIHDPQPPAGPAYEGGLSFARTVQPVLDRYCIGCHGLKGPPPAQVNLLGTPTQRYNRAYDSLVSRRGLVLIVPANRETYSSKPRDYFAHAGKLAGMLLAGHPDPSGKRRVRLDRDSLQRIIDWLDLNGQYYGDYSFNRPERSKPLPDAVRALRDCAAKLFGQEIAAQPFEALVNVALPDESRILKAPLAAAAGGWGQISDNAFAGTDDPRYRELRRLVLACLPPPPRDDCGTCGHNPCACRSCWVRLLCEAGEEVSKPVTPGLAPQAAASRPLDRPP